MCNVIPVKAERVSTHTLMFWAGLGNVIFSFLFMPLPGIELDTLFHPNDLGKAIKHRIEFQSEWYYCRIIQVFVGYHRARLILAMIRKVVNANIAVLFNRTIFNG